MARIPEIIRRRNISQVAARAPTSSGVWGALAEMAKEGADFVRPQALEDAQEAGLKAVYRGEDGSLKVDTKSALGGELANVHNSAAQSAYLSKRSIDIAQSLTEIAAKHQYDPAGFKRATDLYTQGILAEEGIPPALKQEIALRVEREAGARFNGLYLSQVRRNERESDRNTKTQRDMIADDYINLVMGGDLEAAEAKYAELEEISTFRKEAAYISETPAETEAFLRGTRGAAQAAVLTRKLEDLTGATEISDEERQQIEDILDDPDISPRVRAQLYTATQGRLKGIDAASLVAGLTDSSFEGRVISAESAGKATAKNPNSTALGPHQFLKGTWQGLVDRYQPEWAKGLTHSEIAALRSDPAKSSEMYQHFRRENAAVLSSAGLPITPATEYLAHFFGAGGAVEVLSNAGGELVSNIVKKSVIDANPFLRGKTVRDVTNWAARKMTMKASDMAAQQAVIDQIPDQELRAMATRALADQIDIRYRLERQTADEYQERIENSDPGMTEQSILEDHDLSDEAQRDLISKWRRANKEMIEIGQTISDLNNPTVYIDPYNPDDRKRVSSVYDHYLDGESPLASQENIAAAVEMSDKGVVPRGMVNALKASLASSDPAAVQQALEVAGRLKSGNPATFEGYSGSKKIHNMLSDYETRGKYLSGEEAAQTVIDIRDNRPKNVADEIKKLEKNLEVRDITSHFGGEIGDRRLASEQELLPDHLEDVMMADYRMLFGDAYHETSDEELAKNRALDQMGRIYGVNEVSGVGRIMMFPPNKLYPSVSGSHGWMRKQLEADISDFVFGDDANPELKADFSRNWVRSKNVVLKSDPQTRREATSGQPPSYQVYYQQDGKWEMLPSRFVFDPSEAQELAQMDFEDARRAVEQDVLEQDEREDRQRELTDGILDNVDRANAARAKRKRRK